MSPSASGSRAARQRAGSARSCATWCCRSSGGHRRGGNAGAAWNYLAGARDRRARKKRRLAAMSRSPRVKSCVGFGVAFTWLLGLLAVAMVVLSVAVYQLSPVPSPNPSCSPTRWRRSTTPTARPWPRGSVATNRTNVTLVPGAAERALRRARRRGPRLLLRAGHLLPRHRPRALNDLKGGESPRAARRSPSSTSRTSTSTTRARSRASSRNWPSRSRSTATTARTRSWSGT